MKACGREEKETDFVIVGSFIRNELEVCTVNDSLSPRGEWTLIAPWRGEIVEEKWG